jgi:hypothetical protein
MATENETRNNLKALGEVVSSLSAAVSGVTSSSISYELSTILNEVTEQMLLPVEKRDLSTALKMLNQPEIISAAKSGRLPLDVERIQKLLEPVRHDS